MLRRKIRLKNIKIWDLYLTKLIKYLKNKIRHNFRRKPIYFFFFDLVYAGTEPIISKKIKYDKNLVNIYNENKRF